MGLIRIIHRLFRWLVTAVVQCMCGACARKEDTIAVQRLAGFVFYSSGKHTNTNVGERDFGGTTNCRASSGKTAYLDYVYINSSNNNRSRTSIAAAQRKLQPIQNRNRNNKDHCTAPPSGEQKNATPGQNGS